MLTLDRPQDALSTDRGGARSIRVCVRPNGPVVDLPLGKTTVGSSPRCNIRIQQPGVQPLHCLILNEADGLFVRRWAGETRLNGQPVEESVIDAGDCLQVGPAELEIVAPEAVAQPVPVSSVVSPERPAAISPSSSAPISPQPSVTPAPAQTDSNRYRIGREHARSRSRQLLTALRDSRKSDLELQQRFANLEKELQRAADDRQDFVSQIQGLASELAESRRQAAVQQLSAAASEELTSQNEHLGREVCSMIQRIEQLTNELAESSASLHTARTEKESLAAESGRLADEQRQLREQLHQQANHCTELSTECGESRGQIETLRAELHSAAEREAAFAGKTEHLERDLSGVRQHVAELAHRNSAVCGERDEAWRQCESLRANVQAVSERESSLAQTVARLEHDNSQQQLQREEQATNNAALRGERDEAWRQCESLRSNVQALSERESSLAQTVARLEHESKQQQLHCDEFATHNAALCGERDEAWRQCESLRSNVQALSERESSLAQTVARLDDESKQQQRHCDEFATQHAALCDERDEAQRQCDALRANIHALSERESSLAQSVARLENDSRQQQSQRDELANRIAALSAERDDARRQCESLRLDVQSLNEKQVTLTDNIGRLESANGEHQSRETELSDQIAGVSGERDAAWNQCEALRGDIQRLKERDAALAETINRLEREISQHQAHAAELSTQNTNLGNERDDAWRQCEAARLEIQSLHEREARQAERAVQLEQDVAEHVRESSQLTGQIGSLRAEHDDLRDQNEQLRSQVKSFVQERATLSEEQAATNRECETLRMQLHEATSVETTKSEQLAEFVAECRRLREETDRLPQLEQQIRDAVADRENTSSELYRALLQLAEIQERDDHRATLEAAHLAVNAELEKSMQDIAALQSQIDRLSEERIAENAARLSLDRRTAELIEAHQQLAYDKSALNTELTELREKLETTNRRDAELATNLETARLREAELAASLETADASRERLAETEQVLSELTETVARLQGELENKAIAEVNVTAEAVERDRQIAEYAQQLAETQEAVRLLELNTAAASEAASVAATQLEQSRDAWQREREQAAQNHSELLQQVNKLESKLANAESAACTAAQSVAAGDAHRELEQARDEWRQALEEAEQLASQLSQRITELESQLADAQAAASLAAQSAACQLPTPLSSGLSDKPTAEFDWSSRSGDSRSENDTDRLVNAVPESPALETVWGRSSDESLLSAANDVETGSAVDETWQSTGPQAAEAGWTCAQPVDLPASEPADAFSESTPTVLDALEQAGDVAPVTPSRKPEPSSFIERYSHMFANDANNEEPQRIPAAAPVLPARELETRRPAGIVQSLDGSAGAGNDDEESIEDYMVKLLKRVRGDAPGQAVPANAVAAQSTGQPLPATEVNFTAGPLTAPSMNSDMTSPMGFDPSKRRSSMPAPQTDLEALRALANESARRAISRHALRKHRHTLITKVIVSTLAGVTSLWMMLESPHWLNLQSITGCVSLLIAALWAAETVRTLLQSLRVKSTDETDHEIEELSAKLRSPLPIDVEGSRTWTSQQQVSPEQDLAAERVLPE